MFDLQCGHEINAQSLSIITKVDNAKSKKGSFAILVHDTSSCPLHFYQVQSKYSEGYSNYRSDTKPISNKTKKARVIILVRDNGIRPKNDVQWAEMGVCVWGGGGGLWGTHNY